VNDIKWRTQHALLIFHISSMCPYISLAFDYCVTWRLLYTGIPGHKRTTFMGGHDKFKGKCYCFACSHYL